MDSKYTLLLYIAIIFISFFLSALSQRKTIYKGNLCYKTNRVLFVTSFLVSWFFFAFAGMSNDYEEYKHIYIVSNWGNFTSIWIEPGYALLNVVIKEFVTKPEYGLVLIKTLIISLVYKTIFDYRKILPVSLAVFSYLSSYYLDAFCMLRIHLAGALVLYAISRFDLKNQVFESIVLLALAVSIHYSAFILVFLVLSYIYCVKNNIFSFMNFIQISLALIASIPFTKYLFNIIVNQTSILAKYGSKYAFINTAGTGLVQFVLHSPFAFILHQSQKRINENNKIYVLGALMVPFSLYFMYLGYEIQVINRTFVYFMYLWVIAVPWFYKVRLEQKTTDAFLVYIFILIWLALKFIIYINNGSLVSSGIDRYIFLWER